ncbi:MAG: MutS family DNA mismatch repair protein [Ferruginibacter sp.]
MVLGVPLDLVLFWSLQQVLALEQWKKQESNRVEIWLARLAEMEALNSISTIHFNQPDWVFPELKENYFSLEAKSLGHPLINEKKRVNNDISIKDKGELMLITGSNMAGKSTFLRSTGVNLVLAMAGAPVCATYFSFTPVQLISSMRIADNLEESTSTFYAELKKLKSIIDRVNAGEKLFIVLDEILRGTNSHDRHTGSDALIRQLIRHQAAGMIATHDLALADIQQSFQQNILNHHFDVQVSGEELYFDYKLKPGVCQSMNASILMRKIGIENI